MISGLLFLLKCFEEITYNCFDKPLRENDIFYKNSFGFQNSDLTEHTIKKSVDKRLAKYKNHKFMYWIFIDCLKKFFKFFFLF